MADGWDPAAEAAAAREAARTQVKAPPPDGVWIGSYTELAALDLPEPAVIGSMGAIPIVAGETLLLYGPSNLGKSLLALRTVIACAAEGTDVLIVEGEGSKRALRDRIRRLAVGLGADPAAIGERITVVHGGFGLVAGVETWRSALDRSRFSIVMVDPMISYFVGDENASREMQGFLDVVALARVAGSSVIVVHHAGKPDKEGRSSERGSSALRAWADEAVALARGDGPDIVIATHEKSRERGKHPTPQSFVWSFSDDAISLEANDAAPDAVVSAATKRHHTKLLGLIAEAGELAIADARKQLGGMNSQRFGALIYPLLVARRIETAEVERPDAKGRPRAVSVLRLLSLGPKASVGHGGVPGTNETSANHAPEGLYVG